MVNYYELYNLTKNLKVLYVEDDENFRQDIDSILNKIFYKVDIALNGKEAIEKYVEYFTTNLKYYDMIITDVSMPKMNGIELTKQVYQINKNQPIIVISAHNDSDCLLEFVNIGIEQFLLKPLDIDQVMQALYATSKKISNSSSNQLNVNIVKLNDNLYWNKEKVLLTLGQDNIKLTKKETLLMQLFIKNNGKVSTNEEVLATLWNDKPDMATIDSLKNIISRFRKKVPTLDIENIYGLGYKLTIK